MLIFPASSDAKTKTCTDSDNNEKGEGPSHFTQLNLLLAVGSIKFELGRWFE